MEENKSNLMAKIALRLEKIKDLMQGKGFAHFYIPDQFNYDASVDDFFEEEIRDDEKTVFAGYMENAYVAELRYTIMVYILRMANLVLMWDLMRIL